MAMLQSENYNRPEDGRLYDGRVLRRRYKENDSLAKEILRPAAKKVAEWTKDAFEKYDAIVFVGATAIAVRSIAPCLKDKLTDPAVLVVDEKSQYVIPILSGHVGGANALAVQLAAYLQAIPVITTATDIQGLFAVRCVCSEESFADNGSKKSKRDICFNP